MPHVTVAHAARAIGVAASTVRRDVQRGCGGIVRPGEPGRGKGALLDLEAYRRWRDGRCDHDDDSTLDQLATVLARVVREHGGQSRALRRHAEYIAIAAYIRMAQAITRLDVDAIPEELRVACAVLAESLSSTPAKEPER
jgi:hypothetical protein